MNGKLINYATPRDGIPWALAFVHKVARSTSGVRRHRLPGHHSVRPWVGLH